MYSERSNQGRNFVRISLVLMIVIMSLVLFFVIQPTQAQDENPVLVVDMSDLNSFVGGIQIPIIPVLVPNMGNITYSCPNEATCDRVGSFEWFQANQTANVFVIGTYGSALVWEIDGYERNTDYTSETSQNGTTVVTFSEEIQEGTNLLIHIRSITATTEYGVR